MDERKRKEKAEKERMKGNEAIKSKDFDEAISYYSQSIELDDSLPQAFSNRALAYLKKRGTPSSTQNLRGVWSTANGP